MISKPDDLNPENTRRKQIKQALDLRRQGHTYRQISEISGLGRSTARFWCERSGVEGEVAARVASVIENNKEILEEIRKGTSYLRLAKIHGIRPTHALKIYCRSHGIFAYTPAGRLEKLRTEELAEVLELAREGLDAENISKKVNWTLFSVKKAINTGITQPHKRYWDRRGRPCELRQLYNKEGQTQAGLARDLDCTVSQLNILLDEQQLRSRVSQRTSVLTGDQINKIKEAHREGLRLSGVARRAGCTTKAARGMMLKIGLIDQETVDSWIVQCSKKNLPKYQACLATGLGVADYIDNLHRLGLAKAPYSRPIRPDMGMSHSFKRVWSDSQKRRAMSSKMYHNIDLSAERFPDLERLKMAALRARQFRYDKTVTKEFFDVMVSGIYYDPQFSAVFCEYRKNPIKACTPSVDHVIPRSAGGSDEPKNIQFITWFENYTKSAMPADVWREFKATHKLACLLFIDSILKRHKQCQCQKSCRPGFLYSSKTQ